MTTKRFLEQRITELLQEKSDLLKQVQGYETALTEKEEELKSKEKEIQYEKKEKLEQEAKSQFYAGMFVGTMITSIILTIIFFSI